MLFIYRLTHQGSLFHQIQQGLPQTIDGRLFKVKFGWEFPFLQRIKLCFPAIRPRPAMTETEQIIKYSSKKLLADFAWLRPVKRMLRKWLLRKAEAYYQLFHEKFRNEAPDLIVLWSGLALSLAAAAQAARALNIKTLFCENGYLPGTIVMDPDGVNAANSLAGKGRDFYELVEMDKDRLKALFDRQLTQRPLKKVKAARTERLLAVERRRGLPEKFIFLPFQVFDDSQILLYSPRFPDMETLVRYCAAELARFNRKNHESYTLVVKEHPSDFRRVNYSLLKKSLPEVLFFQAFSSQELIERSSAIITVNSTVGIEGLFYFKPVVTVGAAFYNIPDLVYHLGEAEELGEKLQQALTNGVDQRLIEKFLYYLNFNYLVPLEKGSGRPEGIKAAGDRIGASLETFQR